MSSYASSAHACTECVQSSTIWPGSRQLEPIGGCHRDFVVLSVRCSSRKELTNWKAALQPRELGSLMLSLSR